MDANQCNSFALISATLVLGAAWGRTATPRFTNLEQSRFLNAVNFCKEGLRRTLYEMAVWHKEFRATNLPYARTQPERLPDFILIGAQRAGTTSLWENIGRHPGVRLPAAKELHYFDFNFHRGQRWYKAQFRNCSTPEGSTRVGEASPYYLFHPTVPSRCSQVLPRVKLLAILRNPVDRAYSQYNHEIRNKQEWLSFEEAVDAEPHRLDRELERITADDSYHSLEHIHHSYLARGRYVDQLQAWRKEFGPDQILLVCSEEFFRNPAEQYDRILRFLELPSVPLQFFSEKNKGKYSKMSARTREKLVEHFAPYNQRLYTFVRDSWPAASAPDFSRYWNL
jgi:hypothetical protein